MLDDDAEHYTALHNLDYYDNMRPSAIGWVQNDYVPHSPFANRRADRLAGERAAQSVEEIRKSRDRELLRSLGVDGSVSLTTARANAGLPANDNHSDLAALAA